MERIERGIERVYEDDERLIVHKPSGLASAELPSGQQAAGDGSGTVESELGGLGLRARAAHRLDTGTSGLLVLAKTDAELARLRGAWRSCAPVKIYRAIALRVQDSPPLPPFPFEISHQLAHHPKSSRKMLCLSGRHPSSERLARGKPSPALTRITRLHGQKALGEGVLALDLEVEIETGVMHQIRCHLAEEGLPLWCDPIYLKPALRERFPASRFWLHAWKLELVLSPTTRLHLTARLPDGWFAPPT